MKIQKALDIVRAIETLADELDDNFKSIASWICLGDEKKRDVINEAITQYTDFMAMDIVGQGKLLGIDITVNKEDPNASKS